MVSKVILVGNIQTINRLTTPICDSIITSNITIHTCSHSIIGCQSITSDSEPLVVIQLDFGCGWCHVQMPHQFLIKDGQLLYYMELQNFTFTTQNLKSQSLLNHNPSDRGSVGIAVKERQNKMHNK